jgi:hypothetical protein
LWLPLLPSARHSRTEVLFHARGYELRLSLEGPGNKVYPISVIDVEALLIASKGTATTKRHSGIVKTELAKELEGPFVVVVVTLAALFPA